MALTMKIGGKIYGFGSYHYRKYWAKMEAGRLRRRGISARVIRNKADGTWEVWRR